jgi:hypothetical protein
MRSLLGKLKRIISEGIKHSIEELAGELVEPTRGQVVRDS